MRANELIEKAGLPDARLADKSDHLTVPPARLLERGLELLQFGVTPYEPCEPARRGALQTRAHSAGAADFIDGDPLVHPLDVDGAHRLDGDIALGQSQRCRRYHDRPWGGQLLQSSSQVCRLAHGGVVHAKVAPNGANNHIA